MRFATRGSSPPRTGPWPCWPFRRRPGPPQPGPSLGLQSLSAGQINQVHAQTRAVRYRSGGHADHPQRSGCTTRSVSKSHGHFDRDRLIGVQSVDGGQPASSVLGMNQVHESLTDNTVGLTRSKIAKRRVGADRVRRLETATESAPVNHVRELQRHEPRRLATSLPRFSLLGRHVFGLILRIVLRPVWRALDVQQPPELARLIVCDAFVHY